MSFISISFIFYFIPLFFIVYYICPRFLRGPVLLTASILFYSWGNPKQCLVLCIVIIFNYLTALGIRKSKVWFILGIALNLALLGTFKYVKIGFSLPLGLSFYIFQGISYLCDVQKRRCPANKNILQLALYFAIFPKLIMGPIVEYNEIWGFIKRLPKPNIKSIESGIILFCIGLAKKICLAGSLENLTKTMWTDASSSNLSAWLGLISFALQLYFDFSGYSDMAIGLLNMLGFCANKNFDYPYISSSVSEFWRRWHISLGNFFKDYLYIPLGGNRVSSLRLLFNLLIVWVATGIWHGSGLNFIVWGLWNYLFIALEKTLHGKIRLPKFFSIIYCLLAISLGWVFFNSANLSEAIKYFSYLFVKPEEPDNSLATLFLHDNRLILSASVIGATPIPKELAKRIFGGLPNWLITTAKIILVGVLVALSVSMLLSADYSPFIYTEF